MDHTDDRPDRRRAARLTLVSHAATAAVRTAAFPGDEAIDPRAEDNVGLVAAVLRHAEHCWVGPELRARQTAAALGLAALVEPALRDCGYGRWAGQTLAAIEDREPEALATWLHDPAAAPHGGESLVEVLARVAGWLERQAQRPGHTIAVTHPTVIRAAVIHVVGAPAAAFQRIDVAPLSVTALSHDGRHWRLRSLRAPR